MATLINNMIQYYGSKLKHGKLSTASNIAYPWLRTVFACLIL
jgi:hypothetical protein